MKKVRLSIIMSLLAGSFSTFAQTIEENFDDGQIPAGWSIYDGDMLTPHAQVSYFTEAWIPYYADGDTCLASTSYYDSIGQSQDYLITSQITLSDNFHISWYAKSVDPSHPDGYEILVSRTGNNPADFTESIWLIPEESNQWTRRDLDYTMGATQIGETNISFSNGETVYFAFKNITEDGFILLIDDVQIITGSTSTNDLTLNSPYSIYPNPVDNEFQIQNFNPGSSWTIYNMLGQPIQSGNSQIVQTSDLDQGNYIVIIMDKTGNYSLPFVKI